MVEHKISGQYMSSIKLIGKKAFVAIDNDSYDHKLTSRSEHAELGTCTCFTLFYNENVTFRSFDLVDIVWR